ncbi:unnamed protein product [Somion occarium]|uniref:Uncharacterized protein n=1 Tax=Somion occarium TaxID=3059160 RepID=A0ABP1D478_9APHY
MAGGTPIQLLTRDWTAIAVYGTVALDHPSQFRNVRVTSTRILVNITKVLIPAYIVHAELLESQMETSLAALSSAVPYRLLCAVKDLQIGGHISLDSTIQASRMAPLPPQLLEPSPDSSIEEEPNSPLCEDDSINFNPDVFVAAAPDEFICDEAAERHARELTAVPAPITNPVICSHVLGDIWHMTDQFRVSKNHGVRRPFSYALQNAVLLPDDEDKVAVEAMLLKKGLSWEEGLLLKSDWVWRQVRRFASPPEIMFPHVSQVCQTYGPLKDATTGQPLFNEHAWETAKNVLENIHLGYYSDPPTISLYVVQGKDRDGLTLYRCTRGTNCIEGGVHQNIIRQFGAFNASPCFADNLVIDYALCHNLKVR